MRGCPTGGYSAGNHPTEDTLLRINSDSSGSVRVRTSFRGQVILKNFPSGFLYFISGLILLATSFTLAQLQSPVTNLYSLAYVSLEEWAQVELASLMCGALVPKDGHCRAVR